MEYSNGPNLRVAIFAIETRVFLLFLARERVRRHGVQTENRLLKVGMWA